MRQETGLPGSALETLVSGSCGSEWQEIVPLAGKGTLGLGVKRVKPLARLRSSQPWEALVSPLVTW